MSDTVLDDLGHPLSRRTPARRVVSLVPSLTETVASVRPEALVGATDWCTHPPDLNVTRVRGTKNANLQAIRGLKPDLVLANQEENRRVDVERLREAGVRVWVTRIETLAEAFDSLERIFTDALGWPVPGWLGEAREQWARPHTGPRRTVLVPIWRDPWLTVGTPTFTADLLARIGLDVLLIDPDKRYPPVDPAEVRAYHPDLVVLPDEPYRFTAKDGPEAFPGLPVCLVEGRLLTWYGPSLLGARQQLEKAITQRL